MSINWKMVFAMTATLATGAVATAASFKLHNDSLEKKNEFAKLVMEHPEEYKVYQDVERFNNLNSELESAKRQNRYDAERISTLESKYRKLNEKYLKACEKLGVYMKTERDEIQSWIDEVNTVLGVCEEVVGNDAN